jgi:hypothetical protein
MPQRLDRERQLMDMKRPAENQQLKHGQMELSGCVNDLLPVYQMKYESEYRYSTVTNDNHI